MIKELEIEELEMDEIEIDEIEIEVLNEGVERPEWPDRIQVDSKANGRAG